MPYQPPDSAEAGESVSLRSRRVWAGENRELGKVYVSDMGSRVCVGRSSPATSIASRHTKVNGMTKTEHEQASYWAVCFMCDEIAPKTTFWGDRLVCQRCKADLELTRDEENEEE